MRTSSSSVVIFFADIAGSTRLYERLGDSHAHECVVKAISLLKSNVLSFSGVVVEVVGDQVMAFFKDPEQAALAACQIQRFFEGHAVCEQQLFIRIGFHYGPVLWDNGHPFGDTVNVASRMVNLAGGQQIVTTAITATRLSLSMRSRIRECGKANLRSKMHPFNTFHIEWSDRDTRSLSFSGDRKSPESAEKNSLTLEYESRSIEINESKAFFIIGSGSNSDLVVHSRQVSLCHGRIERRQGHFVYFDQSSKGSFVMTNGRRVNDGLNLYVHNREWVLSGNGWLGLGSPIRGAGSDAIRFSVS